MASLDIRRLGLGAMALIGASLVFKGVKGKEISKKEEDNLALEIGIDSVMGAEGVRESRYGSYILNFEFDDGNISWKHDVLPLIEKYTNDWNAQGIGFGDVRVSVGSPKKVVLEKLKADLDALGGYIYYNAESFEAEA